MCLNNLYNSFGYETFYEVIKTILNRHFSFECPKHTMAHKGLAAKKKKRCKQKTIAANKKVNAANKKVNAANKKVIAANKKK